MVDKVILRRFDNSGTPGGTQHHRQKESLRVHSNQKNKTASADFLNSDEQTEQNFCRVAIKWNYVPKTDYSGFMENQMYGAKNTKKHGVGLFNRIRLIFVILSAAKDLPVTRNGILRCAQDDTDGRIAKIRQTN